MYSLNQIIVATFTLVPIALSGCDSKSHSNGDGPSSTQPNAAEGTFRPEEVVVPVKVDSQAGAGFIAKMGNSFFLVTNIHVLSEFKDSQLRTVLGKAIEVPEECFLSRSRDVALVPLKWDASALEVLGDVATGAKAGDPVSVWVPSADATVSRNEGVVVEILPDVVEVTSSFKPGNSGAPILHVASGKVLAIASYYVDDPDKGRRFFAHRLDETQAQQRCCSLSSVSQPIRTLSHSRPTDAEKASEGCPTLEPAALEPTTHDSQVLPTVIRG